MLLIAAEGYPVPGLYNAVVAELAATEHQHSKVIAALQLSLLTNRYLCVTITFLKKSSSCGDAEFYTLYERPEWCTLLLLSLPVPAALRRVYVNVCKTAIVEFNI